ncbi:Pirin [Marinobacterium lacunae]|uniref:Pirin n=1 Tax=Marinobacterium lacunae TaxID=1232683 RepID=A0A081FUI4_9GAMM|nr:pirin family protein [Marinobacterium lacunae]KEA62189.1 Pirin [Marinobacterium lacunae]
MITIRSSQARGVFRNEWLDSRHSFSFGHYYDPRYMGVSTLRVVNDDRVAPGAGFDTHPHRDMEIVSYVLEGRIEHRDTLGNRAYLSAGEVQVMSAGTGIMHSEYNPDEQNSLRFLQLWILPERKGLHPGYAQKDFSDSKGVTLIVSPDGRDGSLKIHQDAEIRQLRLSHESLELSIVPERTHYLQIAKGALSVNGMEMQAGDGAELKGESLLEIEVPMDVEALLFTLAD